MDSIKIVFIFTVINILKCYAELTTEEKLNLLLGYNRRAMDRSKVPKIFNSKLFYSTSANGYPLRRSIVSAEVPEDTMVPDVLVSRRLYDFQPEFKSPILGSPSSVNHLPEAEPILPGHTLIRPSRGMLKSAVKFPHRDLDGESGVYGNINNLGITFAGTGERVLYTGFRRNLNNFKDGIRDDRPGYIIAFLYKNHKGPRPVLRYIDYGELEKKRLKQKEEEEKQKRRDDPYYDLYVNKAKAVATENAKANAKRLIKSLTASGITLEFFEIPRIKLEAMEKEHYHESIKPYSEFIDATRIKNLDWVEQRFPSVAKQYSTDSFVPQFQSSFDAYQPEKLGGIKKYIRSQRKTYFN